MDQLFPTRQQEEKPILAPWCKKFGWHHGAWCHLKNWHRCQHFFQMAPVAIFQMAPVPLLFKTGTGANTPSAPAKARYNVPEVAGVTFSGSAPVPKFLNPGPSSAIFQILESGSCSNSGYNHRSNRNLSMFSLKEMTIETPAAAEIEKLLLSGSGFHKFLTPGPDPVLQKNAECCRSRLQLFEN